MKEKMRETEIKRKYQGERKEKSRKERKAKSQGERKPKSWKEENRNRERERGEDRRRAGNGPLSQEAHREIRRKRRRRARLQRLVLAAVTLVILGAGAVAVGRKVFFSPEGGSGPKLGAENGSLGAGRIEAESQGADSPQPESSEDGASQEDGESQSASQWSDSPQTESSGDGASQAARESQSEPQPSVGSRPASQLSSSPSVDLSDIYSAYALLIDRSTGDVIGEKNSRERIYPASMTKIMTAILAIEETEDLSASVTMPYEIYDRLYTEGASMAGFEPGETATLTDLLYGILLPSGAECCITFANRISGSEEAFAELMNRKAAELGMADTHFCNSTGLHNPDHYTTAADIALLLRYALDNPTFREVFTSSRRSMPPTEQHPEGFTFFSTMFQHMASPEVTGGQILGGKTGYTEEAGLCLASLAEVNGTEYILVTARADGSFLTEPFHVMDAQKVYSRLGSLPD